MPNTRLIGPILVLAIGAMIFLGGIHWTVNRVYVPEGHSLLLRYKGPLLLGARKLAKPGHFAAPGEIGVHEEMKGPGRHFYCPLWWQRSIVRDFVVGTGEVGLVTSKLGDSLPEGKFLVDGELYGPQRARQQGMLRRVYGPGRYRANTYGFEFRIEKAVAEKVGDQVKHSCWVEIPKGYVGVVTFLAASTEQKKHVGIQEDVLPPGIYLTNPREQQIDIVEVGYRETSISVAKKKDPAGRELQDESGEPVAVKDSGISFPSNDGFQIQLDFTAIWGVMPKDAPAIVRQFGGVSQAEQKVILPQSESICRNNGSKMGTVGLLVGETRQQFQNAVEKEFEVILEEKKMQLLSSVVRHIYIPQEVRLPIQNGYIAEELTLTREQERITAKTEADLREAEKKVELESERVRVETAKMVANSIAEGEKEAREIEAETKQLVATIDRKAAELDAQKQVVLGQAEATAKQLAAEAAAQKFKLAVGAFGTGQAYNKWQFAEGLPDTIDLRLFYAGEGTLWTDLKGILPTLPITPSPAKK